MKEIEALYERIEEGGNLDSVRMDIANLIARKLKAYRESFGPWEALYFSSSIAALGCNIALGSSQAPWWLRVCLVALAKALVPAEQRSSEYPIQEEGIAGVTYDELIEELRKLGANAR